MKYSDIELSADQTLFSCNGKPLYGKVFLQALKFHSEGLAAVCDTTGWYHITMQGHELYTERYSRTFGYYFGCAAVVQGKNWFHIDTNGKRIYAQSYAWCGNFQENICTVRNDNNEYFHIDTEGNRIYTDAYRYAGDFKDGFACVRLPNRQFRHIDKKGVFLNDKSFDDLGVFHKGIATAKDSKGWFHINMQGTELYTHRFLQTEVFYNGFALVESYDHQKLIINEQGDTVLWI